MLSFGRDTLYAVNTGAKRIADIFGASLLIVLGSLPAVLYWAAAKLRGVSLYRRERRLGLDACPFDLPMVHDAVRLPATDFVNLPAFVAVLRGTLSLVGPYPLPPEALPALAEWQHLRFDVRPGLVGLWRTLRPEEVDLERVVRGDADHLDLALAGADRLEEYELLPGRVEHEQRL